MKTYIKALLTAVLSLSIVLSLFGSARAALISDAAEDIDVSRSCSLRLRYHDADTGIALPGMEIQLFRFAETDAKCRFTLLEAYAPYRFAVNGLLSRSEWNAVCTTAGACISAGAISPDRETVTDEDGIAAFDGLEPGLWYVRRSENDDGMEIEGFPPFVMVLPALADDGSWDYEVNAFPKAGRGVNGINGRNGFEYYSVIKQWKDEGNSADRPSSVFVELYEDGDLSETVALSADNNWRYEWVSDEDIFWDVIEQDVPDGYAFTVEQDENTFIITNTRYGGSQRPPAGSSTPSTPPTPPTGDRGIAGYVALMCASAAGLVLTAVLPRRRARRDAKDRREE